MNTAKHLKNSISEPDMGNSFKGLKAGVIGYGSIGKRHCENLLRLGVDHITLFRENGKGNEHGFREIYDKNEFLKKNFDFVILSNPTALHFGFLKDLIPLQYNLLAEKPLAATRAELESLRALLAGYTATGMTAYNMRFHPCVVKAEELIAYNIPGKIYSARFFVGQYLPDWRPGSDYRTSYSARKDLGGGVIFDLIHEIDLAVHLCGKRKDHFDALAGKVSGLEIETEDLAEIRYRSEKGAFVSIHLDYLTRGYSRYFEIIAENGRLFADLFENRLQFITDRNNVTEDHHFAGFNRNDMYLSLMKSYLDHLLRNEQPRPSLHDGLVSLETALEARSYSGIYE